MSQSVGDSFDLGRPLVMGLEQALTVVAIVEDVVQAAEEVVGKAQVLQAVEEVEEVEELTKAQKVGKAA
jgi:hypothetical protein